MYSFLICVLALVLGYVLYGRFVASWFRPDSKSLTPSMRHADGVDYVPMPSWRVYMIQLLNIAGTGPIFGAIMGAKFGPSSYLWIVLGCIFAGAVHDYATGMLSIRHDGATIVTLVKELLGKRVAQILMCFITVLLILVGVVFVYSPALILGDIAGGGTQKAILIWASVILIYYVIATLLPIDMIIGKIYPIFAIALLFLTISFVITLVTKWPSIPELWDGLANRGPSIGLNGQRIFPCLFITVACGAVSGFHSTQCPLMAKCIKNEKMARPIFYGAMITEGFIALVFAAVSSYFFFDGGAAEVGSSISAQAPEIVVKIAVGWLGPIGGILALLGVVAAPITTGDTAFRSVRLTFADVFKIDQTKLRNRLFLILPVLALVIILLYYNVSDEDGFNKIWRYFGWANQTLSVIVLWSLAVYLSEKTPHFDRRKPIYIFAFLPAMFMTVVIVTYICSEKVGFSLDYHLSLAIGAASSLVCAILFFRSRYRLLHGLKEYVPLFGGENLYKED